jgi:rare lipoprotein A
MQWNLKTGVALATLSIALSATAVEARYVKKSVKAVQPKVMAQVSPSAMPQPMAYPDQSASGPAAAAPVMPEQALPQMSSAPSMDMPASMKMMSDDGMQYDEVARASISAQALPGFSASHASLAVPSFAEITRLDNGKTILVQIAANGEGADSLGLSSAAAQALGLNDGMVPVRVRKVSPPTEEQSALQLGQKAGDRLDTPEVLLVALRKKYAVLGNNTNAVGVAAVGKPAIVKTMPKPVQVATRTSAPSMGPAGPTGADYGNPPSQNDVSPPVTSLPVQMDRPQEAPQVPAPPAIRVKKGAPVKVASANKNDRFIVEEGGVIVLPSASEGKAPAPEASEFVTEVASQKARSKAPKSSSPGYYVQVAAFSNPARATTLAQKIGGKVIRAKSIYRVKMGPYANAEDAKSAISTASASGFPGARIMR